MTASRYWRITGVQVPAGGLALTALRLYSGADRVDGGAVLAASHAPALGTLAALQDDDLASGCVFSAADVRSAGFQLRWDFGADVELTALRMAGATRDAWPTQLTVEQFVGGAWSPLGAALGAFPWPGTHALTETIPLRAGNTGKFAFHFDGTHGSKVFSDSADTPLAQIVSGGVAISTTQSKFGGASAYFDGTGVIKIGAEGDAALAPGTADFCFETWLYDTGNGNRRQFMGNSSVNGPGASLFGVFVAGGVLSCGVYVGGVQYVAGGITPPLNQWYHLAFVRAGNQINVYINGALVASSSLPPGLNIPAGAGRFALGSAGDYYNAGGEYGTNWIGYADDVRFIIGDPVYTAPFTPPGAPFSGDQTYQFAKLPVATGRTAAVVAASVPVPPFHLALSRAALARDIEFSGPGRITGTVEEKATPNHPLRRRVRLFRDTDGLLVRETWSDSVTGAYEFTGINPAYAYTAIAYDYAHAHRAVAADNLTPEVLP